MTVAEVLALRAEGLGARRIARATELPLSTVRDWLAGRLPHHAPVDNDDTRPPRRCAACGHVEHDLTQLPAAYPYLLGLYLGDGCISAARRGVYKLRIHLDLAYPQIVDECERAIASVMPSNRIGRLERSSKLTGRPDLTHVEIYSYSKSWPCLFPQDGRGRKHTREISLANWQARLVTHDPQALLRGLVQSDGCRFINRTGSWSCPRYSFCNLSADIRRIFTDACDQLGLRWTFARPYTIYVSRKADVALMDEFIGPKR